MSRVGLSTIKAMLVQGRGQAGDATPRAKKQAAQMSDREIHRRKRRAAAARQHGHPEPKNNRIPEDAGPLARRSESADTAGGGPAGARCSGVRPIPSFVKAIRSARTGATPCMHARTACSVTSEYDTLRYLVTAGAPWEVAVCALWHVRRRCGGVFVCGSE